jgi:hypothetical protein
MHPHELRAQLWRELRFQRRPIGDHFDGHGDTPVSHRSRVWRDPLRPKGVRGLSLSEAIDVPLVCGRDDPAQGRYRRTSHERETNGTSRRSCALNAWTSHTGCCRVVFLERY